MDDMDLTTPSSLLDDIENDPLNPYEKEMSTYETIYYFVLEYVVSIVHLLLCVAILLASSLFYYAFYKFKRLQTRTNIILLHYFISNNVATLSFTLIVFLNLLSIWHRFTNNAALTAGFSFLGASLVFAFLLAQDWILSVSNTRIAQKYQTHYKWMIGVVYLLIFVDVLLTFMFPNYVLVLVLALLCLIFYGVNGIVIIVFNVIRYKKQVNEESNQILYALNVANVYYLMWLPAIVVIFLNNLIFYSVGATHSFAIEALITCLLYLAELIAFSSPVVIVCLLAKWNRNFKMACDYVFKKSIRAYELSENDLDDV